MLATPGGPAGPARPEAAGAEPYPANGSSTAPRADETDRPPSSLEGPCESCYAEDGSSKGDAGDGADALVDTVQEARKDVSHRFVEDVVDMEVAATPNLAVPKRAKDEYDLLSESDRADDEERDEDGAPAQSMFTQHTGHFHEAARRTSPADLAEDEAAVSRHKSVAYAEDLEPTGVEAEDEEDDWREPGPDMLAQHTEHFADAQEEDDEDDWREPSADMLAQQTEHFVEAQQEADEDAWREPSADMLAFHSEHFVEAQEEADEDMFGEVDPAMLAFHSGHFDEIEEQTCGPLMDDLAPEMLAFQSEHFQEAEDEADALAALPMEASMTAFHTEHFTEVARVDSRGPDGTDQPRGSVRDKPCEADPRPANNVSSAALRVLQAVSQRDRRIGELTAQAAIAERRISKHDHSMREMEKQIGSLKMDAAHFDLDIEWYRRALQDAEASAAELEAKPAPANVLKLKDGGKTGPADQSTRSDMSTATGTSGSGQTRLWTPQTPTKQQALAPLNISTPLSAN